MLNNFKNWKKVDINNNSKSIRLSNTIKNWINFILSFFNIKIIKISKLVGEKNSFIHDDEIQKIRTNLLTNEMKVFFSKMNINMTKQFLKKNIKEFNKIFSKYENNESGGFGYNNAIFLYIFCKKVNPKIVWESGVFMGFTTFILEKATSKQTKIFSHDINFKNLKYKSPKAIYINKDIEENFNLSLTKSKNIFFFDDHVSQLKRFNFVLKNDLKYCLFDDDISISNIISDGYPALPTLNMIKNNFDLFNLEKKIKWSFEGEERILELSRLNKNFNKLFKKYYYHQIPNLSHITGYKRYSHLSFLIKK